MHFDLQPKQSLKDYFPEASMAKSTVKSLFCQLNNGTSMQHIRGVLLVICLLNYAQNIRKLVNHLYRINFSQSQILNPSGAEFHQFHHQLK